MAKLYGFLALLAFSTSCYAETSSYSAPSRTVLRRCRLRFFLIDDGDALVMRYDFYKLFNCFVFRD